MSQTINQDPGQRPDLRWIDVDLIDIDHNYQREVRPNRVRQILSKFSWDKFGAIQLAQKEDGRFACYDGQHRLKAAQAHPKVQQVPATILRFSGLRDEADAFLGVNINRSAVTPVERYWAGLEAGDPDTMTVCSVLADAECDIVPASGVVKVGLTSAVTAVSRSVKSYGDAATVFALTTLRLGWPNDPKALKGTIIQALARLHKSNPGLRKERMVSVLQSTSIASLSGDAEAIRKIAGGDASTSIARTLAELYNKGLKTGQIYIGAKGGR